MIRYVLFVLFNYYLTLISLSKNMGQAIGQAMGQKEGDKPLDPNKSNCTYSRMVLFFSIILCYQLQHVLFLSLNSLSIFDWVLFLTGTLGIALRMWSVCELGEYYTFNLGIRKDHKLITTGPYTYLVHPGQIGHLLVVISGIFFCGPSIILNLVVLVPFCAMFCKAIVDEEKMMTAHFAAEYQLFVNSRNRFIPKLW